MKDNWNGWGWLKDDTPNLVAMSKALEKVEEALLRPQRADKEVNIDEKDT